MTTNTIPSRGPSRPVPWSHLTGKVPFRRLLALGFALWGVVFAAAASMYTWRVDNRPLFEAVIPIVLALSTTVFGSAYLSRVREHFVAQSALIGAAWTVLSILFDLPLFMGGPTHMRFGDYLQDIGVTYLMIPIITVALGYQRELGARSNPS